MAVEKMLLDSTGLAIKSSLDNIVTALNSRTEFTWERFKNMVRGGLASLYYPQGTILPVVVHTTYGNMYFRVEYYYTDSDGVKRVKLWAWYEVVSSLQYDAPEAFYYCSSALSAGTYNFTMGSAEGSWTAGTYCFTLTQSVPAGGTLGISGGPWSGALTALQVRSYSSRYATSPTESVSIASGSSGTSLGTLGAGSLNHPHRIGYGSNNWAQSAVRQFLNSDAVAGSVWQPQTNFDMAPSWVNSVAGFKRGLPSDFLAVLSPAVVKCATNNVYETGGYSVSTAYTVNDYFYLPSTMEVYGTSEGTADGSVQFPLYVGTSNSAKIKYKTSGTATSYYWLRSAYPGDAYSVRLENTPNGGASNHYNANLSYALFPACDI